MELITLIQAAQLSGKSIQTIRRMIKRNKIRVKKQKTPQGFNYLVLKDSLFSALEENSQIQTDNQHIRDHRPITQMENETDMQVTQKFNESLGRLSTTIHELIKQQENDKKNFFDLIKTFQGRIGELENHIKLLEAPKANWWQFWK